jgi:5-methylcytosine-specific restriction endonuclease McrA
MYPLGSLRFHTKIALKNYVKPIIDSLGICEILPDHKHFQFLYDLFKNHPEYDEKTNGKQIIKFSRKIAVYNSLVMFFHTDEKEEDFSWDICCFNFKSKKDDLNNALRNAIKDHIDEYRNTLTDPECVLCKSKEKIQIDHIYPFSKIRDEFIIGREDIPSKFDGNICRQIKQEDDVFKQAWIEHHNKIATYQPLCKKCNLKKSNK